VRSDVEISKRSKYIAAGNSSRLSKLEKSTGSEGSLRQPSSSSSMRAASGPSPSPSMEAVAERSEKVDDD